MATKNRDRWRVRWTVAGRERSKTFPAGTPKKLVDEYERKLRIGLIDGALVKDAVPSVSEYAKRFQEAYPTIRKRSHSTQLKDSFTLRDHIVPRFGGLRLTEVKAGDVLAWQLVLHKKGLAPQTVNNIVSCLSSMFRLAVLEGAAEFNPCASVPRVPRPKSRPEFWTPGEARKFLAYAREQDFAVFQVCYLAICSGLRPGELMGLRRDCLDFDQGVIDNRRHYCTKRKLVVDGLKNGLGYRVPVARAVFDVLADKRGLAGGELVFPWLSKHRAFGWLVIKPMAEAAGVKPIGFHKLRHTFASHLVMAKRHPVEIRNLMGHKKLDSTEVYMHLADELAYGATDCIAEGLGDVARKVGKVVNLHGSRH